MQPQTKDRVRLFKISAPCLFHPFCTPTFPHAVDSSNAVESYIERIENSDGKVSLASATFHLVDAPKFKIQVEEKIPGKSNQNEA